MPIDTSISNQKIAISPSQSMFDEGASCNSLNLIHEGSYEIEKVFDGVLIPILENSGKNLTPGVACLFTNERYPVKIISKSEGLLSTYQITRSTIKKNIMSKASLGVAISKTLLKEVLEIQKKATVIHALNVKTERIVDNLSASYFALYHDAFKDINPKKYVWTEEDPEHDPTNRLIKKTISTYIERGGDPEIKPTKAFLSATHPDLFKKSYSEKISFDDKEFVLIRKMLSLAQPLQNTIYEAEITILIQLCEKLTESFYHGLDAIEESSKQLHSSLKVLIGQNGILDKFITLLDLYNTGGLHKKSEDLLPVFEFILNDATPIIETYKSIFHKDYTLVSEKFPSLKEKISKLQQKIDHAQIETHESTTTTTESTIVQEDNSAILAALENSSSKIMNYAELPQDQMREYSALILKLKSLKNPLDPEQDARVIRKNLTKIYWDAYKASVDKFNKSPNSAPKSVELMLKFGFFDETLLAPKNQVFLHNFKDQIDPDADVPLHRGSDWLNKVTYKKIPPSISELGETYFDKIKSESKDVVYKKESDVPDSVDTYMRRLGYEMDSMYQPNVRLVTGNPSTFLPILTDAHIITPLDKCTLTHQNLKEAIHQIISIDYTAFNREAVYNNESEGILRELIQTSVIPDFISVPSIGTKIMMWKDLGVTRGAGSKETRGRIILPIFIQGDLKTMLTEAIAAFRWELCKTILGVDWNNVGVPSLTSEYTDYVMFYKKNKDLSIELKEKIAIEFKRFRTDRDKFVNDYVLWLKYESEGIQKLNRVVRGMFYKYIPFQKIIRDKISTQPAFSDIHTRFVNIRGRQYRELEAKYKKYQESHGGVIPQKIQANLDFYKV